MSLGGGGDMERGGGRGCRGETTHVQHFEITRDNYSSSLSNCHAVEQLHSLQNF